MVIIVKQDFDVNDLSRRPQNGLPSWVGKAAIAFNVSAVREPGRRDVGVLGRGRPGWVEGSAATGAAAPPVMRRWRSIGPRDSEQEIARAKSVSLLGWGEVENHLPCPD